LTASAAACRSAARRTHPPITTAACELLGVDPLYVANAARVGTIRKELHSTPTGIPPPPSIILADPLNEEKCK